MREVDFDGKEAAWMPRFHVIREQFPYSKMRGLEVGDGAAVSFNSVQYRFVFGRGVEAPRALLAGTFDEPNGPDAIRALGGDPVSRVFLERLDALRKNPPPKD